MERRLALLVVLLVLGVGLLSGARAQAATPPPGAPIDIPEASNIGATLWNILINYVIPIGGVAMAATGITSMVRQRSAQSGGAWGGVGGGIGMQFIPSAVGGAQRAAPAADSWLASPSPWFSVWQGLTGQSLVSDPIVWFIVGLTLYLAVQIHRRAQQRLA